MANPRPEFLFVVGTEPVIREDFGRSFLRCDAGLGAYLNGHQLRAASESLDRFGCIFCRQSSHQQRELTVGCHLNRGSIDPLHILSFEGTSTIHFHKKFCGFHSFFAAFIIHDEIRQRAPLDLRASQPRSSKQLAFSSTRSAAHMR